MLNKVILIGNLGADPEIKDVNGQSMARLRLATTKKWKDKQGEMQERTEWHTVSVWQDGLVRVIQRYLQKGSKVYIEGELRTRSYDKDGETRYSTEVVLSGFDAKLMMLDSKPERGQAKRQQREEEPFGHF